MIAPDATPEAKAIFAKKKNLRLLTTGGLPDPRAPGLTFRSLAGGFLVQSRDNAVVEDLELKVVTKRQPTAQELADLKFAFKVAKHVKSNAIVYAKDGATVGIGAGQMSRVDSARIAALQGADAAKAAGETEPLTKGSVVASDAFFPFADGLLAAAEAGATAVIQPGGSMRDDEVIAAADASRPRHGLHRRPPLPPLTAGSDPAGPTLGCDTCHAPLRHCRLLVRRGRRLGRRRPRFEVVLGIRRDARRGRRRGPRCHGGLAGLGARAVIIPEARTP